jgi:ribonuclease D
MAITLHRGDLPTDLSFCSSVAIDTETLGLNPHRDPLCLVQISAGDHNAHIVQLDRTTYNAPNLCALIGDPSILKIFHFARFDVAVIQRYLGIMATPIYCTKIASKLARTYASRHGLKDLAQELVNIDMSKQQQSSDWGAAKLTDAQLTYAASDVLHLHDIKAILDQILIRERRDKLAKACFSFLPVRAELDLSGWAEEDIFIH